MEQTGFDTLLKQYRLSYYWRRFCWQTIEGKSNQNCLERVKSNSFSMCRNCKDKTNRRKISPDYPFNYGNGVSTEDAMKVHQHIWDIK
jgi:hypothetical protein